MKSMKRIRNEPQPRRAARLFLDQVEDLTRFTPTQLGASIDVNDRERMRRRMHEAALFVRTIAERLATQGEEETKG